MSIGGSQSKGGYDVTGGGTNAPWTWGVSDFDQSQIDAATGANSQAVENRYQQLGMGGSTPEQQDVAGAGLMGQAMTGQEQTANVGQPALNPALQPQENQLIGAQSNPGVSLGSLAGAAGKLAAL
ncbi:MAG TPA: hypothetical protein VHT52_12290 [Stellaceae bacterium]|jgi:hypothetical protein|nr:hypothetical protein [Stellaceae bacterium]